MVVREGKNFLWVDNGKIVCRGLWKKIDFVRKLIVVIKVKLWNGSKLVLSKI